MPGTPAVLLGTAEVTPLALTAAYSAFATLGTHAKPRLVLRVEDRDGAVIWSQPTVNKPVLSPATAYILTSMLEDVVDRGTATAVRAVGYRGVAAGKTGTTDDAADVWFVGYTPVMVGTSGWGFDGPTPGRPRAPGGELAAPVWGRVMRRAGQGTRDWLMPMGVVVRLVDQSGSVYGERCPRTPERRQEYFLSGTGTVTSCNTDLLYTRFDSAGRVATDSLVYTEDWQARLRRRIFRPDTLPPAAPVLDTADDRGPRR
jgi:penicillin-binding protein 1A